MSKPSADFFDVVFPLNLGPLTYVWPSGRGPISAGALVRAQVKQSVQYGIVFGRAARPHIGRTKEILEVISDQPVIGPPLLHLIKWMSNYYIVNEGLALKGMFPKDVLGKILSGRHREPFQYCEKRFAPHRTDNSIVSAVRASVSEKRYKTYLLNVPSFQDEVSYLLEIIKGLHNVIVLVPESSFIDKAAPALRELAGERLTILHGKLTKAQRGYAYRRILSGESDIVLGTRPAVFAPLKSLSLIAVLQEHNVSYKNIEGIRYHGRDVAVMRAYLEKSTAMLSSPCPTIESFYNATTKKYSLLKPAERPLKPRVEVIDMRFSKKITPHLSKRVVDALAARLKRKENILLLVNRKGYSIIQCSDCSFIESCPECGIPLVYHKDAKLLKCHYCNRAIDSPDACKRCRGSNLAMIGAGTQRIAAELERNLGVKPALVDKDVFKENAGLKCLDDVASGKEMIVGTKFVMSRLPDSGSLDLCVFLNPDISLHLPDFRASEFLFHQIYGILEHIKPEGLLLLQTRIPENPVFKHIRTCNFEEFFREELSVRRSLSYPPFSKMALISVSSTVDAEERLKEVLKINNDGIEVIGPYRTVAGGKGTWKLLLKSPYRERLNNLAKLILKNLEKEKSMKATADVDPISV